MRAWRVTRSLGKPGYRRSESTSTTAWCTGVERRGTTSYKWMVSLSCANKPDVSVPAIFAAQVVEHLAYDDLIAFLELSRAKLKPGGRLIFETVNPHALEAFKTFWTDLTHQRPIFPEVALVWCWLLGFERAHVLFPHGGNDLDRDLTTQGDYGIVATKGSSS